MSHLRNIAIMYNFENKLCSSSSSRKKDGTRNTEICPGKHSSSSATLPLNATIGDERDGGRKIGAALLASDVPLKVGYITTDQGG